jgi:transcription elongation factor
LLRRIFVHKRQKLAGGWRRLQNEELHNLYNSLNIIRVIKSKRMRWAGHVVRIGDEMHTKFWSENLKQRDHLEDLGVDGKIMLD